MAKLSVETVLLKAKLLSGQGKKEEAKALYTSILQKFPNNKKARSGLAMFEIDEFHGSEILSEQGAVDQLSKLFKERNYKLVSQRAYALTHKYPKNFYIWSFLGGACQAQKEFEKAALAFGRVIQLKPNYPQGHNNLGIIFQELGRFEQAVGSYQKACALKSDYFDAHYNMGVALKLWGHLKLSIEAFERSTQLAPSNWAAYDNLGSVLKAAGEFERAVNAYEAAILINPNNVGLIFKLGSALDEMGQSLEAISQYQRVLSLQPNNTDAYGKLIVAYLGQGDVESALVNCEKLIAMKPNDAEAYNLLGAILFRKGFLNKAIISYKKAIEINPNLVDAIFNLGTALFSNNNVAEALDKYSRAISTEPNHAGAHNSKGMAFIAQGKLLEAQESIKRAIELNPDLSEAHQNMGDILLAGQDFKKGFELSEWRWKTVEWSGTFFQSPKPVWSGEKNKCVLVWGEQGIGDEIMFSSMVPEVSAISSKVILHCDDRLIPLFKRSFPANVEYSIRSEAISDVEFDFHIPIGSLATTFRPSRESFKVTSAGFLNYDQQRTSQLRETILTVGAKKIIGIGWNSESPLIGTSKRNIKLSDLAKALAFEDVQLVSLQYGDVDDEIKKVKSEFGINIMQISEIDNKNDLDGLASLIMACDDIVSTTNAMVHLAGALGANIKVLLPFSPRWIWGGGSDSFWYDTATAYKQKKPGEWGDVLQSVAKK